MVHISDCVEVGARQEFFGGLPEVRVEFEEGTQDVLQFGVELLVTEHLRENRRALPPILDPSLHSRHVVLDGGVLDEARILFGQ